PRPAPPSFPTRRSSDLFAEVQLVCPSGLCGTRERATRWGLAGGARVRGSAPLAAAPEIAFDYERSLCPDLILYTDVQDVGSSVEDRKSTRLNSSHVEIS